MPIVTISIALRAKSPAKQGSPQKTLTGELRLRDHLLTIQTIAVGFVLIGLAQALRLLLALVALQQGH